MASRSLRADIPGLPAELIPALEYEKSTFSNGSVYDDEFYKTPPDSLHSPAGTLLKCETANPRVYQLPPLTSLSRIIYQSIDFEGKLVPVSGYVLFPYSARRNSDGSLQVVAWAHGTSGLFPESGPSHIRNLWQHYLAPFPLALQGFVVVATDYAGLGLPQDGRGNEITHEYLTAPAAANDILHAVQAARKAFPELGRRFVSVGHSQGGGAVWKLAEMMKRFPVEGYLGSVSVSPVTRVLGLPSENNPLYDLFGIARLETIQKKFPEFDANNVLSSETRALWDTCKATGGGATTLMACLAESVSLKADWDKDRYVEEFDHIAAPGGKPIQGPLLVIQGDSDPIVNVNTTTKAVNNTIEANPSEAIRYITLANVTHAPAMFATQARWIDWVKERFDGNKPEEGLGREELVGHRPVESYAPELNWYIGLATEFYHAPI